MSGFKEAVGRAVAYIKSNTDIDSSIGIVFGSGLGGELENYTEIWECAFNKIPYFPVSTLDTQGGRFRYGIWNGVKVIILEGRVHWYEGYSSQDATFGVRVLNGLGVKNIILTGIIGYIGKATPGELALITDHINLIPDNPLRGQSALCWGARYPDMLDAYNQELRNITIPILTRLGIPFKGVVLAAVGGPNLETRAEYRALQTMGATAVSMSTVPETIAAVQGGSKVLGLSVISDLCDPDELKAISLEELISNAQTGRVYLLAALEEIIGRIGE